MLISSNVADERLTTAHRAKLAYVYVRQSSVNQVRQHQESTELQYRLVDRAIGLGWPAERVQVIDEDLGKSGAGGVDRHGFQKLIAEIGLGNAGLVVSLDASRLARNNRDWHQLLELCSVFGVVIADGERLYDPRAYHDRLLLGLSGIMSEAELDQLRMRLHQGERQKAARGELRLPLPGGLAYDRAGTIILNPDEEVQARLHLVFAKFRELQSACRVMRYLDRNGLSLPVRPLLGPSPHEVVWRAPDSARVLSILQNPAYAGAYVYGRRQKDPSRCQPGSLTGTVKVAIADWAVCLHAAHPGYISWKEFMANQGRLADNVCRYEAGHSGVPRKGAALLQGIAVCGRCGRRMSMRYTGPHADYPVYCCRSDRDQQGSAMCQEVRALAVDALVERIVLDALVPDQIEIALAAAGQLEQKSRQLERRIVELNAEHKMDGEIAAKLNQEGFVAARGCAFKGENVWLLRTRWGIPTVKINGVDKNPMRWPDGSFSIQGAAAQLGVTPQTVFDYLARGLLVGRQLSKGQPWQIELSDDQIRQIRNRVRRTKRSKKEAS
ncbi:DNA invertase Pin-like site-specific DNA recombinase [Bradyrhizobium yuanmingense]|uniref:recombinase family protein n=1 Tax=Bradyrhizobium yuanmingense TaxID=108015 RepID=UPI00351939E4